jgi:7-cyano-7-deazaguanine synthase
VAVNLAAWGGSSLTDPSVALPVDGLQPDLIPSTYVPGRNTVFIAIGLSLAEARGAERLVLGVNAVDYSGYPDCRPDYLAAFQSLAELASRAGREGRGARLWAPLIQLSKVDIVREALRLGVPIDRTWSCYSGGEQPCGVCDSCRIRDAALRDAGRPDLACRFSEPRAGRQDPPGAAPPSSAQADRSGAHRPSSPQAPSSPASEPGAPQRNPRGAGQVLGAAPPTPPGAAAERPMAADALGDG